MLKGEYAFYNYGISGVEEVHRNPNLLILKYGIRGLKEFYFRKKDSYKLLQKILGQNELDYRRITEAKVNEYITKHGYSKALNDYLNGRAVVFVTEFANYLEYYNGGQNDLVGLTGIDLDGEYIAKEKEDLFPANVTFEEMYPHYEDAEWGGE